MQQAAAGVSQQVREAGYEVLSIEQLRSNRWLVTARADDGTILLVLAQRRPLISSADVQDLAELLQLQRRPTGILLALEGNFTPEARRTAAELRRQHILLCTSLPTPPLAPKGRPVLETA